MDDTFENIDIYDFDGTLYKSDSSVDFCFFVYKKKPLRIFYLLIQLLWFIPYKINIISTIRYKHIFFCFLNGLDKEQVEKLVDSFWEEQVGSDFNAKLINKISHAEKDTKSICISASPEILLKKITKELGLDLLIGTEMTFQNKKWTISKNCRGKEKINRLHKACNFKKIAHAYSDNKDDHELLKKANKGYLVFFKKNKWGLKKINKTNIL